MYELPRESVATAFTGAFEDPVPSPAAIHEKVGAVDAALTGDWVAVIAMNGAVTADTANIAPPTFDKSCERPEREGILPFSLLVLFNECNADM